MLMHMEPDLAELGIDSFEFGGSMGRKILILAQQAGFYMPMSPKQVSWLLNTIFNSYCKATRDEHETTDYLRSETTFGVRERRVEREVFGAGAHIGSAA